MFVPQLLEKKIQQNLEFPKYHIVNTPTPPPPPPPPIQETFGEQRQITRGYGGGVCDTPPSLSHRVYPYNFVGQILKIFKCLRLKGNSGRRNFDKFTKILLKNFITHYLHHYTCDYTNSNSNWKATTSYCKSPFTVRTICKQQKSLRFRLDFHYIYHSEAINKSDAFDISD
jgi:hypothetical protein